MLASMFLFTIPAQAINKEWSAGLGFLGGVLVANAYDNHCAPTRTYYESRPVYVEHYEPRGYYTTKTERYWVPGRRVIRYTECGRRYYEYEPGHYEYRDVQVWVQY